MELKNIFGNAECPIECCRFKVGDVIVFNDALNWRYGEKDMRTALLTNINDGKYMDCMVAHCGKINDLCYLYKDYNYQVHIATEDDINKWNAEVLKKYNLKWNYWENKMEYLNGATNYDEWLNILKRDRNIKRKLRSVFKTMNICDDIIPENYNSNKIGDMYYSLYLLALNSEMTNEQKNMLLNVADEIKKEYNVAFNFLYK